MFACRLAYPQEQRNEEYGAFLVELRFERFIEDDKKQFGVTHKGIARRNRSNEGGTLWAHGRPRTRLDARLRTLATSRAHPEGTPEKKLLHGGSSSVTDISFKALHLDVQGTPGCAKRQNAINWHNELKL
nr:hypothetical protein Iba_chr05dCG10320 [Ipomoea batatas]